MRLIDADKLIEELTIKAVSKDAHIISIANAVVNFVNNQPTAYDADSIIKELENASKDVSRGFLGKDGNKYHKHYKAVKLSKAIEIIKKGGVIDG